MRWLVPMGLAGVLLSGGFVAAVSADAQTSVCFDDGGGRVEVCIWQDTVTDYVSGDYEYVQVKDYRFRVRNLDSPQTTLTGGSMEELATVYGQCVSGCSAYRSGALVEQTVKSPVSGHVYTVPVPWKAAVVKIPIYGDTANAVQAARATIRYHWRGRAETFESPSLCTGETQLGICS